MIRATAKIVEKRSDVYAELMKDVEKLNGSFVKVGFPTGKGGISVSPGSPSTTGSGHKPWENMSEVARIAVWLEFGVPKKNAHEGTKRAFMEFWQIPPRPFFREAIDKNRDALKDFMGRISADVMVGKLTPHQALESVGIWMQDKVKRSITTGDWKPNAPSTVERKGSSKPLIDSGQMRNSVTFTTHGLGEARETEGTFTL